MNGRILERCQGSQPCAEVLNRVIAADRARDLEDVSPNHPAIASLLTQAEQWKQLHLLEQRGPS